MFFDVCFHSCLFLLHADWQKSDSSVDGELQGNWRWNLNSRDTIASSFPSPALPPERPGKLAHRLSGNLRVQTTSCKRPLTLRIFGDRLGKVWLYFFMTNADIIILQKCPFEAITIINLPSNLEKETTHRYSANSFKLHRFVLAA